MEPIRLSRNMVAALACALVVGPGQVQAAMLDLSTLHAEGTINGAIYSQVGPKGAGTGHIDTFVQVQTNDPIEQAYNTTVNNTLDNGASNIHNHAILVSDIPLVNISGTNYRQFLLDINETGNGGSLLSLDEVQIFQSATPNQSVESFASGLIALTNSTLVYRMDASGDNWVKLDSALVAPGSGQGDMYLSVPDSLFSGSGQYLYLYSKFGVNYDNDAGFEEWAPGCEIPTDPHDPIVPEPSALWLVQIGALAMAGVRYRRSR